MKRNKFIAAMLAVLAAPMIPVAQMQKVFQRNGKGFKVGAGEGRIHGRIQLKGVNSNVLDVKVSGSDTNGDLAVFEQTSLSQGRGTPLHIQPEQDEYFYVLEGSCRFKVGDDLHNLAPGDSIFLPRKVPHAWTQVSERGRMTVILQPAGKLENFFVTMSALDHEPTQAEMAKLFANNGMQLVGPPLKLD